MFVNKTCKFVKIQINKEDHYKYLIKGKESELVEKAIEISQDLRINKLFKEYQLVEL